MRSKQASSTLSFAALYKQVIPVRVTARSRDSTALPQRLNSVLDERFHYNSSTVQQHLSAGF
ncbi:MAG: hypothetical protein LH702_24720 [Phormidesmis sp. CAN_BIN44]|nr:hypothetical protein [Phormidesmis sp. CAN_BIN44]